MANEFKNKASFISKMDNEEVVTETNEVEAYEFKSPTATKEQSLTIISKGNIQHYTIKFTNNNTDNKSTGNVEGIIDEALFSDVLPIGLTYVDGSFKVNGITATPITITPEITYKLTLINPGQTIKIEFDCELL